MIHPPPSIDINVGCLKWFMRTTNVDVDTRRSLSHYRASNSTPHLPEWHSHNLGTTFQYVHNPVS